jgi:hypothetical protein
MEDNLPENLVGLHPLLSLLLLRGVLLSLHRQHIPVQPDLKQQQKIV